MNFPFQLLCTLYFAALTWTLYPVMSTPKPTPRPWLFGIGAATVLLLVLHAAFGITLGNTRGVTPKDKFYLLLQFSGALIVMQVINPWMCRTFANHAAQKSLPVKGTEKILAINCLIRQQGNLWHDLSVPSAGNLGSRNSLMGIVANPAGRFRQTAEFLANY